MLLVPLSKMIFRGVDNNEFVFPFTDRLGESRTHADPEDEVGANIGDPVLLLAEGLSYRFSTCHLPMNFVSSMPPRVISALPTSLGVKYMLNNAGTPRVLRTGRQGYNKVSPYLVGPGPRDCQRVLAHEHPSLSTLLEFSVHLDQIKTCLEFRCKDSDRTWEFGL